MMKMEGTYIRVAYKNVSGYISTNSWPFFMIQRPTIRGKCAWVRTNTWWNGRPVFSVFRFFDKCHNWQPKKFRICATATSGLVFCSWVQFDFGLFSSPANWTCEHYPFHLCASGSWWKLKMSKQEEQECNGPEIRCQTLWHSLQTDTTWWTHPMEINCQTTAKQLPVNCL